MDIVVREEERRPRSSRLSIDVKSPGSSVGSSFFIVCSIRSLARIRGNYRYVAKIEDASGRGEMLVGFLLSREENLAELGEEFRRLNSPQDVIDLEQFGPVCDLMK